MALFGVTGVSSTANDRMTEAKYIDIWLFQHNRISFSQCPLQAGVLEWNIFSLCTFMDLAVALLLYCIY